MSEKEIVKEYSNGEMTVVWKPNTCIHSTKCWKGLIQVFNPKKRPWINIEGATTERIKNQVEECPSGALTYYMNEESSPVEEPTVEAIQVKITGGGPILVRGEVKIVHKDGTEEIKKNVALCRCGQSANKPFCDGSHHKIEFDN
jgi:uncharacterized Fe-S cluster protein YjdI